MTKNTTQQKKSLTGSVMVAQSGGPTAVINASAYGVIKTALEAKNVTRVLWAGHGVNGILSDNIYDINAEDPKELALLMQTPAAEFGSCRKKIKEASEYQQILETFKKHDVRYFFYIGGNDSMDTCNKINDFMKNAGHDICVWGVPKTIDNDLESTDHCPGFGSAAKYVAATCMEISKDSHAYDTGQVTIVEVMGRNAGWLTGASALATKQGAGPDLIYLPEVDFDINKFHGDVENLYKNKKNLLVAVSEGIRDKDGKYIAEYGGTEKSKDSFGHAQLGGLAHVLAQRVKDKLNTKVRPVELSLMQRCGAHIASKTDVDEAFRAGEFAMKQALLGNSGNMAGYSCKRNPYSCEIVGIPLSKVANHEKKVPETWITKEKNFVTDEFINYVSPLIQGESGMVYESGLPRFARLKKLNIGNGKAVQGKEK